MDWVARKRNRKRARRLERQRRRSAWRRSSLTVAVVSFRLVEYRKCKKASQGALYGQTSSSTRRSDFDWTRHAAGLRAAGDSQRGAAGATEPAEAVREAGARGGAASGYLCAGCVLRGGGAGAESTAGCGEMPVVVLEQTKETAK